MEGLAQTEAGGDGSDDGNERVPDGDLPHRVTGQQLVIEREADGGDANEQQQDDEAPERRVRQRAPHQQSRDDQQGTTHAKAVARADEDVHPPVDAARHQSGKGAAEGVDDNHAVAEQRKRAALLAAEVQRQYTEETDNAAQNLPDGHLVALEEHAGKDDQREDTQRIEDGRPRPLTVGQADVEGGIVEGGIQECEEQQIEDVARHAPRRIPECKRPAGTLGHSQDDDSRQTETDAGEEHLAAGHVLTDSELSKTELDERVGPSPDKGRREGEDRYPRRALKDAGDHQRVIDDRLPP